MKKNKISLKLLFLTLFLICIFKPIGFDRDSQSYVNFIQGIPDFSISGNIEPSFYLITYVANLFDRNNNLIFFSIYASLGLIIKYIICKNNTTNFNYSSFTYICLFFILHELTQIRVGVAIGFYLISLIFLYQKKYFKFFLFLAASCFFHYSSAIGILSILAIKIKNKKIWFFFPFFSLALSFFLKEFIIDLLALSLSNFSFSEKITIYRDLKDQGYHDEINIINPKIIFFIFLHILIFLKIENFQDFYVFLSRILSLSISTFYLFSEVPVFAFRISEFFSSTLILLIPYLLTKSKSTIEKLLIISMLTFIFILDASKMLDFSLFFS